MWKKWRPAERAVLILSLLFLLTVGVFPVLELLFRSMVTEQGLSFVRYQEIFSSHRQVALLLKTVAIALGAVVGALLLGVPYAFAVNKLQLPSRRLLAILGFLPLLLSPHVQVVSWVELYIQVTLKHPDFPFDIYSVTGAVFIEALTYFPLVYLIMFFGLRSLDRTMEEASYLARGTGPTLRRVVFPLMMPYIFTSAIFVFLFSLSNFGIPSLLRIQVFSVEVLYQLASYNDVQKAAATAAPFVLLGIAAVLCQWMIERRMRLAGTAGGHGLDVPRRYSAGALALPITALAWIVALVTFVIPIAVLIWQAGGLGVYLYSAKQGTRDIMNSLILAVGAATLTGLIGSLVAIAMRNSRPSVERGIDVLSLLPFALPPSLLGIKLILIWNQGYLTHFLYPTILMSVLAFFTRFITFPVKIMAASMRQMDPYLEEAARLANVAWWKNLWLLISMNARGFWASWLLVYILVHGELGINLLIDPPGFNTLTTRIFNLFHYGRVDVIASLSLISVVMLAVPFLAYLALFQRKGLKAI